MHTDRDNIHSWHTTSILSWLTRHDPIAQPVVEHVQDRPALSGIADARLHVYRTLPSDHLAFLDGRIVGMHVKRSGNLNDDRDG